MKRLTNFSTVLLISTLFTVPALAQELIIYPNKGQSQEVMERDKYNCYQWAKKETGFDPMEAPKATQAPPREGAAIGGLLGGVRRSRQTREQQNKQDQWAQEQAAQYSQKRNTYNRAYAACLEGKGYTVK